jgi:SAM-dependent methyltransferase
VDSSNPEDKRSWWEKFYNDSPFIFYLEDAHKDDIDDTLAFLTSKLDLAEGSTVFDQCCGIGSLSLALAMRGITVYGCDIAGSMIARAQADARHSGVDGLTHFAVADAFTYVCPTPADAAFNWYTSFGYAGDEDNLLMFQQAYSSLKPGGRFALDYPNVAVVLGKFKKSMVKHIGTTGGEMIVTRESAIDARNGRLLQTWTFLSADGTCSSFDSSVRLYLPNDLCRMLEEVGFGEIELYGNTAGDWLNLETNRCIVVAKRP